MPGNSASSTTLALPGLDPATPARRRIMHLDMDAFFAAVELRRRPELRGQPMVVGGRGDPSRRGVVSTCTYEARVYGIHSGMALRTAARLCPDAVFLPVDMAAYREASEAVFRHLHRVTPVIQAVGLDEAYLDVSDRAGDAVALARALKQSIREDTGLVASVGIGPNRLLAKIASDLEKPDGLTCLGPGDLEDRVWPLNARVLHGVGPKTGARLAGLGIETVGDLARTPLTTLSSEFSERHARALHDAAHGRDERPVQSQRVRKSIGRERTFQTDCRSSARLAWEAEQMLTEVHTRLCQRHLLARTVTVKIRYRDFTTHTRSQSLTGPTDDFATLAQTTRACLYAHRLHRAVRLLGVQLAGLEDSHPEPARP